MDYSEDFEYSTLVFYRQNHGKQLYYSWEGDIWWVEAPGKPKEKLFSIIGMNATKGFLKTDPEYGEIGHRLNREIGLFCDPETKEILSHWQPKENSQKLPVVHIANRMVQGSVRERKIVIPKGQGYITRINKIPLEYPHPLAQEPKFKDYCSGETFKGVEYFTSSFSRPGFKGAPSAEWARDCPWMPWMKLGYGHPARLHFETTISRVESFEELNPKLVELVRSKLPIYEFTPDQCDEPNITSSIYFKKHFDSYLKGESFPIEETA
ncbi:MAG: DUF1838 domain-containing protein [Moorea sp. SIOASIH]|uniref:DUF1838 family protein n=1 Tax=Moorena sp. SIOASIH TaxID=2607817 RepID=UPI0013B86C47|nr:DUF1838 family protein [Moorena sp. SIOASIH]NEO39491.1 DUF1838 domain-containing protein [Moorena sp. SIOASIH]